MGLSNMMGRIMSRKILRDMLKHGATPDEIELIRRIAESEAEEEKIWEIHKKVKKLIVKLAEAMGKHDIEKVRKITAEFEKLKRDEGATLKKLYKEGLDIELRLKKTRKKT